MWQTRCAVKCSVISVRIGRPWGENRRMLVLSLFGDTGMARPTATPFDGMLVARSHVPPTAAAGKLTGANAMFAAFWMFAWAAKRKSKPYCWPLNGVTTVMPVMLTRTFANPPFVVPPVPMFACVAGVPITDICPNVASGWDGGDTPGTRQVPRPPGAADPP